MAATTGQRTRWPERRLERRLVSDGWSDGGSDGWPDAGEEGWSDGWREGWSDGWSDGRVGLNAKGGNEGSAGAPAGRHLCDDWTKGSGVTLWASQGCCCDGVAILPVEKGMKMGFR